MTDESVLNTILEAARCAVSADNGQPWKLYWRESRLFLRLDLTRAISFFDTRHYAAYLAVGSLIENLCIAAQYTGYKPHLELFPDCEFPDVVASIFFSPAAEQQTELYRAIFERTTNRRPYRSTPISAQIRSALLESNEHVRDHKIVLVDEGALKRELAEATAELEAIRFDFSRKEVHSDFFSCLRFTRGEAQRTGDGLWIPCLEGGVAGALALRMLAKWSFAAVAARLGAHRAFSHQSVSLLRHTPVIALVISSSGHSPPNEQIFLTAGRVCQRLWLTATMHGLACQPMAIVPLFFAQHASFGDEGFPGQGGKIVNRLKGKFKKAFKLGTDEHVMMVFRFGYAKPPSARSFRRPLQDLVSFSDDSAITAQPL